MKTQSHTRRADECNTLIVGVRIAKHSLTNIGLDRECCWEASTFNIEPFFSDGPWERLGVVLSSAIVQNANFRSSYL
jgi:hypothetical protein